MKTFDHCANDFVNDMMLQVVLAAVRLASNTPYATIEHHSRFATKFMDRLDCAAAKVSMPVNSVETKRVLNLIGNVQQIHKAGGISYKLLVPRLRALDLRLLDAYVGIKVLVSK